MSTTRSGGLYYIKGRAVDSEGVAVADAPPRAPNTVVSPSLVAQTPEERIGIAIVTALRGAPVPAAAPVPAQPAPQPVAKPSAVAEGADEGAGDGGDDEVGVVASPVGAETRAARSRR